jgi:cysteine-rich repeat protein
MKYLNRPKHPLYFAQLLKQRTIGIWDFQILTLVKPLQMVNKQIQFLAFLYTWGDRSRATWETCDDGNDVSGDGWDVICNVEVDWTCTNTPPGVSDVCTEICGDGMTILIIDPNYWDDGNNINGDGWSSAWAVESGWFCSGGVQSNPDIWIDIWGDGIVMAQAPTYCDDGNNIDGDGWSLTWTVEDGWTCTPGDSTSKSIWEKMISKNSIFSELMKELSSKPYISTAGIISALISSLITLSSPNNVWQIGNLLQMFMLLLLLNIYIPEKVIIFITTNLFALLSFDIPFLKEIRDYLLGDIVIFFESEQKDEKLKLLEAKSGSTPINASNSVLVLLWVIVIHAALVYPIFAWTSKLKRNKGKDNLSRMFRLWKFIWDAFTFSFYIRFIMQSSQFYIVSSLSELLRWEFDNAGKLTSWIIALLLLSVWVLTLFLNIFEIVRIDPHFEVESLLKEFTVDLKKDKLSCAYNAMLLARRFIFIAWILWFKWLNIKLSISILAIFQGFYTLAIWIIRPFKAAKNNLFEIINEVVYFTVIFWLIVVGDKSMWTGWVTDAYIFILMSPGFFMLILILGKVSWVNN